MIAKRKIYTPAEKAKIALEAIKGVVTINELSSKYQIHPTQINNWSKQLRQGAPELFTKKRSNQDPGQNELINELYEKIGRLEMEKRWLKKKSELFK